MPPRAYGKAWSAQGGSGGGLPQLQSLACDRHFEPQPGPCVRRSKPGGVAEKPWRHAASDGENLKIRALARSVTDMRSAAERVRAYIVCVALSPERAPAR